MCACFESCLFNMVIQFWEGHSLRRDTITRLLEHSIIVILAIITDGKDFLSNDFFSRVCSDAKLCLPAWQKQVFHLVPIRGWFVVHLVASPVYLQVWSPLCIALSIFCLINASAFLCIIVRMKKRPLIMAFHPTPCVSVSGGDGCEGGERKAVKQNLLFS